MFENAEVIDSYTRAQAIEDGVLIDVSNAAKEAGFRIPIALTTAVWADCVAWDGDYLISVSFNLLTEFEQLF